MIRLSLLHPGKSSSIQNWTFDNKSKISIGRSEDNDVVIYSAVVSRHHVEIRANGPDWELVSLGVNGTYVDGQPIATRRVIDGMIISLAGSGPKLQIHLQPTEPSRQSEVA